MVLCLALVFGVGPGSAQEPACSFYKVNTRMLNVSKDAAGEAYIDVLVLGEIACVTRQQKVEGRDRGYVAYKLESSNRRTPVNGWATLSYTKELSPAEAAALAGPAPPVVAPNAPPTRTPPAGCASRRCATDGSGVPTGRRTFRGRSCASTSRFRSDRSRSTAIRSRS